MDATSIPVSLYVHFPWCVRKCPYCDFNSHAVDSSVDEGRYVAALLKDLEFELPLIGGRTLKSVFVGGGTPSLLSGSAVRALLGGIRSRIDLYPDVEITMEANPGAVDAEHFPAYREAGVNRLSIGVQSFDDTKLAALGRIHTAADAASAFHAAADAGFDNINLDLMFGLPSQDVAGAMNDLGHALELGVSHLSWYQLTIEPHTEFAAAPPADLPVDDDAWDMQEAGQALLESAGFQRYEVSAWARHGGECRHNRNYWEFGDYLGIGAGAHGKLTNDDGRIERRRRHRNPKSYLAGVETGAPLSGTTLLQDEDLVLEFMMNALRLDAGVAADLLESRTGLSHAAVKPRMSLAVERGLLEQSDDLIRATPRGRRFLNDLLTHFV